MSTRPASDHPEGILRAGRLRFSVDDSQSRSANDASKPTSTSPSAVAKAAFASSVETLPKDVQTVAVRYGTEAISHYVSWKIKQAKYDAMVADTTFIPKPLRFNVKLDVVPEVRETAEFKDLSALFELNVTNAGIALKAGMLQATKMSVEALHCRYLQSVAKALPAMAEILLAYYDSQSHSRHRLVMEFLGKCETSFCTNLRTTIEEFGAVYLKTNNFHLVPPPQSASTPAAPANATANTSPQANPTAAGIANVTPGTVATDQAPPVNPYDTPRNAARNAPIINGRIDIEDALCSFSDILSRSLEAYHSQILDNDRKTRVKQAFTRQNMTAQQEEVGVTLASEMHVSPVVLEQLIDKKVNKKLKSVEKENAKLKKQLVNAKSGNGKGAQHESANVNKSTVPPSSQSSRRQRQKDKRGRKAVGAADATLTVLSTRGQGRSRSTSKEKKGTARQRNGGSRRASGHN